MTDDGLNGARNLGIVAESKEVGLGAPTRFEPSAVNNLLAALACICWTLAVILILWSPLIVWAGWKWLR